MRTQTLQKLAFRVGITVILLLMLVAGSGITHADAPVTISLAIDLYPVVGNTPRLYITITNPLPDTIHVTKLQCDSSNSSLRAMSINQLPSTIPANGTFQTYQYYRAMSGGTATISCTLTGTDTVTGASVTATGTSDSIEVQSETRLYYSASSGTHVATVGQAIYIDVIYGNRGKTPFTITEQSCTDFGNKIVFTTKSPAPSTILPPGQTFHVQYGGVAISKGDEFVQCILRATDSDGNAIRLFSPAVNFTIK